MTAGFASAEASGAEFAAGGGRCIPYPAYKESGVEWLGLIPAHWDVRRLKYVAPLRESRLDAKHEEDIYVGLENIESWTGRLQVDVQPESVESVVGRFEAGDVLFGKLRPYLAKAARPAFSGVSTSEVLALCPVECTQSYLLFSLLTDSFIRWFGAHTYGTRMPRVGPDQVGNSFISLPPSSEQRDIANFLDRETAKIDALLANKEQLIELLQEKRTALITRAVTKGLDPNVSMKDTGVEWLGEIPAHWEIVALRRRWEIIDCKHVTVPFVDQGIPLASVRETQSFELNLSNARHTTCEWYAMLVEGKRSPRRGDLVYCRNVSVGSAAFVNTDERFAMGQDVCTIRSAWENQKWLNYYLCSNTMSNQLATILVGSTFDRINVSEIRELITPVPPRQQQDDITAFLDCESAKIDALVTKVREAIDRLKELRTALISAAVTGKIDVRETAG